MTSKDAKGRTLFDILTGRNKRDLTPLELQYHNPFGARVGQKVSFECLPEFANINFDIEKISVYETKVDERKFFHTDYHLKGVSIDADKPLRFRIRLIPDEDETNKLGCKVQLLHNYDGMEWDEGFYQGVLCSDTGVFEVNQDDEGVELAEPRKYWRVEDVLDPYRARVTVLVDKDGDGKIDDSELERYDVVYWDYHRETVDENNLPIIEFLSVEMNDKTRYFTLLRGTEVRASQVFII